ncbi:acyl-CoA dehydrogenase family protein [Bradyrhizobium sp. Tv2a-2]|uniref:acyl-CoA dehydrogenase family protein n=1 Tax=Bradyrhizobium sp. Tv2a-2 TaxID=113395 RepID=UPI000411392E|nr:acyl-CoA dehydrogenase family protein [Bradyrhizobium sp. Tv2a-2]
MTTRLDKKQSATSNIGNPDEATLDQVLTRINALAPVVARHVRDIEENRRLPEEIVAALKSARIYSMLVPRRYGGLELDAPSAFRAVSALARLDGSVGWNVMIGHLASLIPFVAHPTLGEQIFQDGKDHIFASSAQPVGTAERVPGGWRVTGVWPFASGCQNAEWIVGSCVMTEGGSPIDAADGPGPMIRTFVMPAEHWEIRDTWHTFGLRGTGSHDVALTDVIVPNENFFEYPFGIPFAPDPLFGKFPELLVLSHGALAVGIAEGAILDLVELATTGIKQRFMTTPLVETERFKEGLGRLDADLKAARALLEAEVARVWQSPERAAGKDLSRVAEQFQAVIWITATCVRVAEGCFELAGSRAIFESSPLQRRVRDLGVAAQHLAVQPRQYVVAGTAALARLS